MIFLNEDEFDCFKMHFGKKREDIVWSGLFLENLVDIIYIEYRIYQQHIQVGIVWHACLQHMASRIIMSFPVGFLLLQLLFLIFTTNAAFYPSFEYYWYHMRSYYDHLTVWPLKYKVHAENCFSFVIFSRLNSVDSR